jgi:peptidyl-prolyl cis-trans isomerase D
MLQVIRKFRNSFMAKVVVIILAASFVIGFGVLGSMSGDPSANQTIVARVDDKPIYRRDFDEAHQSLINRYREQLGAQFDEKMLEQLPLQQIALQNLVSRRVLLNEAAKAGLRVTDEDLRDFITQHPAFQTENGGFDPVHYERVLRSQGRGLNPARFEAEMRESLLIQRLQSLVDHSILITDTQLREIYVAENEKASLRYVAINPADLAGEVQLRDQDVIAYYEARKEEFVAPEQRSFEYVEISPAAFARSQKVTEQEVAAEYAKRAEDFRIEEEVRASHILVKAAGEDESVWEAARLRAVEAVRRARGGADFEKLSKELSEDASANQGGDLGFFGRNQMVKPFEDAAFAAAKGEITDPIRSIYGWHVIKVTDRREPGVQPLSEVREQLERGIRMTKGEAAAKQAEDYISSRTAKGEIDPVAEKFGLPLKTTGLLARDGQFPGVLDSKPVLDAGFQLAVGQSSGLIDAGGVKVAIETVEVRESRQMQLAEVRPRIERALRAERSVTLAASRAAEMLEQARARGSLRTAAGSAAVKETGPFNQMNGEVPGIGQSREILAAAFGLTAENPLPDRIFQDGDSYYVVELVSRERADMNQFQQDKEEMAHQLREKRSQEVFNKFVETARSRARIDILLKNDKLPVPGA